MVFEEHIEGNVAVLSCSGHFFFLADGGDSLRSKVKEIIERGFTNVLFDFTNVLKINSAGLGVLMACLKSVMEVDGSMKICGVNESVQGVFKITNFGQLIDIVASYDDALHGFAEQATL